ncbi:MAG TPA: YfhO family protein, partial [Vicinamibacteria bacterium]|nr:YfhO family protein [Vicinamibacteria bacterium]
TSMYWSLHPATIVDMFVPRLATDLPLPPELRSTLFESREPLLACLYLGMSSALLVALGLLMGGPLRILGGLGFAWFLAAALGHYTPFYPLLIRLPAIGLLRYPVKYAIPTALFWALLVGVGGEAWRRAWSPADGRRGLGVGGLLWLLGLALLVAGVWIGYDPAELGLFFKGGAASAGPLLGETVAPKLLGAGTLAFLGSLFAWARARGPLPPAWLTAGLALLMVGDLGRVGRNVNPLAPPELLSLRPPIVDRLRSATDYRIYVATFPEECARLVRGPGGWEPNWSWARGTEEMLYPPIGARWGLFGSYDGDFSGLASSSLWPVTALMASAEQTPLGIRLLQIGNVEHVVSVGEHHPPGLTPLLALPSAFACPLRLFRVPEPLPRAYVVAGVRSLADAEGLTMLVDPAFDPVREVVLPPGNGTLTAAPGFQGRARILWRRADALELEVDASTSAILVLVEAFGPGWRASVDGQPVEVLKANLLFRAVRIPSGRHRVAFIYRPPSVFRGAALSAAGLVASVVVWRARGRGPAPNVEAGPPSG